MVKLRFSPILLRFDDVEETSIFQKLANGIFEIGAKVGVVWPEVQTFPFQKIVHA